MSRKRESYAGFLARSVSFVMSHRLWEISERSLFDRPIESCAVSSISNWESFYGVPCSSVLFWEGGLRSARPSLVTTNFCSDGSCSRRKNVDCEIVTPAVVRKKSVRTSKGAIFVSDADVNYQLPAAT